MRARYAGLMFALSRKAEGLIERHVRATTPVTISYTPSAASLRLIEVLEPLVEWGAAYGHDAQRPAG